MQFPGFTPLIQKISCHAVSSVWQMPYGEESEDSPCTKKEILTLATRHVTFEQLSTEHRLLVMLAALAASLSTGDRTQHSDDKLFALACDFWDGTYLTRDHLHNLDNITDLICTWLRSTRMDYN